eukprot:425098_1
MHSKIENDIKNNDNQDVMTHDNEKKSISEQVNKPIHIIHFNDVYDINNAPRFMSLINDFKVLNPIILFSGDFLSPSNMSCITKGEHMVTILNEVGIDCACIGNHELDFGEENCIEMFKKLNFPVLNTNILTGVNEEITSDKYLKDSSFKSKPVGYCKKFHILNHNGLKIGLLGISENWIDMIAMVPQHGALYINMIDECQKWVNILKNDKKCDMIIVLTHSLNESDIDLSQNVNGIDFIFGGHNHKYFQQFNENNKT